MKTVIITAVFEVQFRKTLTDKQVKRLEAGESVENFVDESEAYRRASSEGTCEMEWDYAFTKATP